MTWAHGCELGHLRIATSGVRTFLLENQFSDLRTIIKLCVGCSRKDASGSLQDSDTTDEDLIHVHEIWLCTETSCSLPFLSGNYAIAIQLTNDELQLFSHLGCGWVFNGYSMCAERFWESGASGSRAQQIGSRSAGTPSRFVSALESLDSHIQNLHSLALPRKVISMFQYGYC